MAAWCIVIICLDGTGYSWHPGHLAGSVSTAATYGDYLGACGASSDIAELHSLAWGLMYGIQFGGNLVQRIEVCFDFTYAFGMGNCFYSPKTNHTIVVFAAGLCDLLKATTQLPRRHESSHEGLPFNEFADVGAKWQRRRHYEGTELTSPASRWAVTDPEHAEWAFPFASHPAVRQTYPLKMIGSDVFLSATVCPVSQYQAPSNVIMAKIDDFQQDHLFDATDITLQRVPVFQFNPQTLGKGDQT